MGGKNSRVTSDSSDSVPVHLDTIYRGICGSTVKTLNIGTPRPATIVVLNLKQFNFTMK